MVSWHVGMEGVFARTKLVTVLTIKTVTQMLCLNMDSEVSLPCCLVAAHCTAPNWARGISHLHHHGVKGSWKNKDRNRNVTFPVYHSKGSLAWFLLTCFWRALLLGQNLPQMGQWCPSLKCLESMCFKRLCFQALPYPHCTQRHTEEPFPLISWDT